MLKKFMEYFQSKDEKKKNNETQSEQINENNQNDLIQVQNENELNNKKEDVNSNENKSSERVLSNVAVLIENNQNNLESLEFAEKTTQKSWFLRLKERLSKTKNSFIRKLGELFGSRLAITDETIEKLEEILIEADVGVKTTQLIISKLNEKLDEIKVSNMDELFKVLKDIMLEFVTFNDVSLNINRNSLSVVLVLGVNGVGKTTTIGKIAANLVKEGKKPMIVAADTFRAGAIEQAEIWAKRVGIPIVKSQPNSDPAAVVYDSIKAALARKIDVLLIDTAGRLHTKYNLMEEIKKIKKVISREIPDAPHEILQVLDATSGQNALIQVKTFNEALGKITGIALTKLDGTAKGGIVISICNELKVPIKLIGIGEAIDDLKPFNGNEFINALFEQ